MAERRMFAKTIIDSDAFLDMPMSTQALYFHLGMRADDEGFINNAKKIQKIIGASDDDMKLLIAKNFIIPFESGVIVIKHWRIHNYIRCDRLKETAYVEEKSMLTLKDNDAYSLIPNSPLELPEPVSDYRKKAYQESTLPYSFEYKIKRVFYGKPCPICGCIMENKGEFATGRIIPTIQHNIPLSKGGKHELGNISIICRSCNITIQDKETGDLNALEVIEEWDKICQSNDRHMSAQDRIGKVREDKINYVEILDYLNLKCNTSYKSNTKRTQECIRARYKEGFTFDDFKTVIDKKVAEWKETEWEKFLRPETLFGTKFESYLNQKAVKPKPADDGYNGRAFDYS